MKIFFSVFSWNNMLASAMFWEPGKFLTLGCCGEATALSTRSLPRKEGIAYE